MRFLIAAQLPRRLAYCLREAGHGALHTLDLPNGNRTSGAELNAISLREQRVVVTKGAAFVATFVLSHQPFKLLLISAGNISNADLEALFLAQIPAFATDLATFDHLELTRSALIVHA